MTHFEKEKNETHKTIQHHKKISWNNFQKYMGLATLAQIILMVVIIVMLSGLNNSGNGTAGVAVPAKAARPSAVPNNPVPTVNAGTLMDDDAVLGDPNAPVTIVEFSDYECPFCERFYSETFGQINDKYIKTRKVNFVYRDFPLSFHPQAQKAAEAAECAGEQDKYYEMNEKLFTQGVSGGVNSFKQYAKDLGLNTAKFNSCLDSGEMASEVKKDFSDGQKLGVQGTPGFFINGVEVSGAQPFVVFQQAIEAALAE